VSAQTLKNIPIEIQVEGTATPIPSQTPSPVLTATPISATSRIREQLIENSSAIVVAMIGLIGTLVGAYVFYANNRKTNKSTSVAKRKK